MSRANNQENTQETLRRRKESILRPGRLTEVFNVFSSPTFCFFCCSVVHTSRTLATCFTRCLAHFLLPPLFLVTIIFSFFDQPCSGSTRSSGATTATCLAASRSATLWRARFRNCERSIVCPFMHSCEKKKQKTFQ